MVKDKIARDAVIDEYTVSTIVCQAERFRQLSEDLNDLVDKLPQDKVWLDCTVKKSWALMQCSPLCALLCAMTKGLRPRPNLSACWFPVPT